MDNRTIGWDYIKAKTLMKEKGRTPQWLAKTCGVTRGHMYLILNGKRAPSMSVLKHLAVALEVPEDELLRSTDAA